MSISLNPKLPLIIPTESIYLASVSFYNGMVVPASSLCYELVPQAFDHHRGVSAPYVIVP